MAPPSAGRSEICNRTQARFHLVNVTAPSDSQLARIFESILIPKLSEFDVQIKPLGKPLVAATIAVYKTVIAKFLPTPDKSLYQFNLRDVSKVVEGLCLAEKHNFDSAHSILRLWLHECSRVFSDRFVSEADRSGFVDIFDVKLRDYFEGVDGWAVLVADVDDPSYGPIMAAFLQDPADNGSDQTANCYEEVVDFDVLQRRCADKLYDYNAEPKLLGMKLVLFKDAILHVTRIHRVLIMPRGNMMLVGVGGSGRQSLTRLASYIAETEFFTIEITRNYRVIEWHDDLKRLFTKTGIENKPTTFYFSDTQLKDPTFLEEINSVLTSGLVPNLFAKDEIPAIIDGVRKSATEAGSDDTASDLWSFFIERIRANLHIVLAMSPVGTGLRVRCRFYPGLINNCFAEDHELLTNRGFMSLAEYMASPAANRDLQFASYNPLTKQIVYEQARQVHINEAKDQDMIEFSHKDERPRWFNSGCSYLGSDREIGTSNQVIEIGNGICDAGENETMAASGLMKSDVERNEPLEDEEFAYCNGISIIATPQHDMFVQVRDVSPNQVQWRGAGKLEPTVDYSKRARVYSEGSYEKHAAEALVRDESAVRFLAFAEEGRHIPAESVINKDARAQLEALGCDTGAKVAAFLYFYGYWLGCDGSFNWDTTDQPCEILCRHITTVNVPFLKATLDTCEVKYVLSTDYVVSRVSSIAVRDTRWVNYFYDEYGKRCALVHKEAYSSTQEDDKREIDLWLQSAAGNGEESDEQHHALSFRLDAGSKEWPFPSTSDVQAKIIHTKPTLTAILRQLHGSFEFTRLSTPLQATPIGTWKSEVISLIEEQSFHSLKGVLMAKLVELGVTRLFAQQVVVALLVMQLNFKPRKCVLNQKKFGNTTNMIAELAYKVSETPFNDSGKFDCDLRSDSAKPFFAWVMHLSKDLARCVIAGLEMVGGYSYVPPGNHLIFTSSVVFRDAVMQLLLHAGYSASFQLNEHSHNLKTTIVHGRQMKRSHDHWRISYTEARMVKPVIRADRDNIQRVRYSGRTWCAEMPHGYVVVRRAFRFDGKVIRTSRPTIQGNCSINVFDRWPADALKAVGGSFLAGVKFKDESLYGRISDVFTLVHMGAQTSSDMMLAELKRHNYVTPTHFLELARTYKVLLSEKSRELEGAKDKLANGLAKLIEARNGVRVMSIELEEKKVVCAQSQRDCEGLLVEIVSERRVADEQRKQVEADSERIANEELDCKSIADDAQTDLDVALPALEKAMAEVEKLDKGAISEVKAYKAPPKPVETVLAAVMILFGNVVSIFHI